MRRAWPIVALAACAAGPEREEAPPPTGSTASTASSAPPASSAPADPRGAPASVPAAAPRHDDGTLFVDVRDPAGDPVPCRLTFVGAGRTPTPRFTRTDIGVEQTGGILAFDRAFVLGAAELEVPVGDYEVWVSHGPEWEIAHATIAIRADAPAHLRATLVHSVATPGWLSGDFHVHAEASADSRVPMRDRVHQFVADGVDLIVATDHNVIADYGPVIDELRVGDRLASLTGDEITTRDWGHFGAFPLPRDEGEAGDGAVAVAGRTPRDIFADVRARAPDALIDIHHPRLDDGSIGYFHLARLDPATLRAGRDGFSRDFDAIEVLNGYQDADRASLARVLDDWFGFLRRGQRVTATGNSDTHHLTFNLGGYPRNYVQLADDRPGALDPAAVVAAVRGGRAYLTTGPIVDVTIDGHGLGDTAPVRGTAAVRVRVRAPSWMAIDRLTVLRDGEVALRRQVAATTAVVRFDEVLAVPVTHDGFVVVRVDGDRAMAPMIGDAARFPVYPLAITNPIWLDADGDGQVRPTVTRPAERPARGKVR